MLMITAIFPIFFFIPTASSADEGPDQAQLSMLLTDGNQGSDTGSPRELDLDTAKRIALSQNPSLLAIKDRIVQAREQVVQALSRYWPRLDAETSLLRNRPSDKAFQEDPARRKLEDDCAITLMATYILFDGFDRRYTWLAAQHGEEASEEAFKDATRLLLGSVSEAYYNTQLALENIAIARENETFNNRQLSEARLRNQIGTGSLSDVLDLMIQVKKAEIDRINAQEEYDVAVAGLIALLGISSKHKTPHLNLVPLKNETDDELVIPDPKTLIEYAEEHRPDHLRSIQRLKQAEAEVGKARAAFFPTLSLMASLDGTRKDNGWFQEEDFGYTYGVMLSYNLFAGGYHRSKMKEASAKKMETQKDIQSLKTSMISEIHKALSSLKSARERLLLLRNIAGLETQNRDLAEKEYTAGMSSLMRLNEAQRDLVRARRQLALSLVSLRLAWQDLKVCTAEILVSN